MRSVGLPIAVGIDGRSLTGDRESLLPSGVVSVSFGPELLLNGGFDTDTVWTKGTGWTISGGVATITTPGTGSLLSQPAAMTAGRTYRILITVSSMAAASILVRGYAGAAVVLAWSPSLTAAGTYERYVTAPSACDTFALVGGAVAIASVESVSLKVVQ